MNINKYLNISTEDVKKAIYNMEHILNNELFEIILPIYYWVKLKRDGKNLSGYPDEELSKLYVAATNKLDCINKDWDKYSDFVDGFLKNFGYEILDVQKYINHPEVENMILTDEIIKNYKKDEIINILSPEPYKPNEIEISLNHYRFVFVESIWDILWDLPSENNNFDEDKANRFYLNVENMLKYRHIEGAILNSLISKKWFLTAYVVGLEEMHGGDCTAIPCACMRCHSEELFNIPPTSIWGGKSNGYYLLSRLQSL